MKDKKAHHQKKGGEKENFSPMPLSLPQKGLHKERGGGAFCLSLPSFPLLFRLFCLSRPLCFRHSPRSNNGKAKVVAAFDFLSLPPT